MQYVLDTVYTSFINSQSHTFYDPNMNPRMNAHRITVCKHFGGLWGGDKLTAEALSSVKLWLLHMKT